MNPALKPITGIITLIAAMLSCVSKPLPHFDPPQGKAILYHLPVAYQWIHNFPHNSLMNKTTTEACERESWFNERSKDLDIAYAKFKGLIQNGDEIWKWSGNNAGMFARYRSIDVPAGICIIRSNKIIAVLMTQMTCNTE